MVCRRFLPGAEGSRQLVSGGNDSQIVLWSWQAALEPGTSSSSNNTTADTEQPVVTASWQHTRKVNSLAVRQEGSSCQLYVGDTSKSIGVINVRTEGTK